MIIVKMKCNCCCDPEIYKRIHGHYIHYMLRQLKCSFRCLGYTIIPYEICKTYSKYCKCKSRDILIGHESDRQKRIYKTAQCACRKGCDHSRNKTVRHICCHKSGC